MFSFQIRINHWWPTYGPGHFLFRFFWITLLNGSFSALYQDLPFFFFWTIYRYMDTRLLKMSFENHGRDNISHCCSGFRLYTRFQNLVNRICTWTHKWRGSIAFGLSHGWWRGSVANLTGVVISISPESWCFRFLFWHTPSLMCAFCLLTTWIRNCFKTYQKLPLNISNSVKKPALLSLQCYKETQQIKLY